MPMLNNKRKEHSDSHIAMQRKKIIQVNVGIWVSLSKDKAVVVQQVKSPSEMRLWLAFSVREATMYPVKAECLTPEAKDGGRPIDIATPFLESPYDVDSPNSRMTNSRIDKTRKMGNDSQKLNIW